ncbi:hypothetical protein [Methyloglobulus sp.]|uniref:hypothetical protein n=1 Tax=Methyloglobulus sp. TaxID=2518622 RepID=UPI0039894A2F
MNDQLINLYNATGFNRVVDFVKTLAGGNSEMPLGHVLLISRVLFAVVMTGFIGYFFDRMKQSLLSMENKAKTNNRQGR